MIRFGNLKIRTKIALVLVAAMIPMLVAEVLTIHSMRSSLRDSAELELSNLVKHLHQLCVLQHRKQGPGRAGWPTTADIKLIEQAFRGTRVGKTGYPYVMNSRGDLIVHPAKAGENIYGSRDSRDHAFIKEICEKAVRLGPTAIGTIRYPWRNVEEGETSSRMKIVKYTYFRQWDWIVAAGAYEKDIYAPVVPATRSAVTLLATSLLLVILFTWGMSRLIARPVIRLSKAAARLSAGDLDEAVATSTSDGSDEVAVLARSFADMARRTRNQKEELEQQVAERTRELNDSREQYRRLVENAVDCIVTADRSGTITFANNCMEELLGIDREQIVGRKIWSLYKGGVEQARYIMRRIRAGGSIRNYEQTLLIDERSIPILTSASLIFDANGKEAGTMGIFTDVTKLKELEDELAVAQVNLAQVHKLRALGDLVAGVAHEVNNPLMASTTMLRVIERNLGSHNNKLGKQIDVLKKCNQRITKIVYHLREFSRQTEIDKQRIDVNVPLSNALLISTQQLLNMQIELEQDLAPNLPAVLADANLIEQVFLDLFANARDAMRDVEGDKRLWIHSRAGEMNGRPAVQIEVGDTGPGIPPEVLDKIFEPFFTTKPVGQGTGLGLPICLGIIENHNGRIDLRSSKETGTVFTVWIPAVENAPEPLPEGGTDES